MGPAPGRALGAGSPHPVTQDPDELDRRIAQADRRRRVRFRLSFAGTWLLLVGGLLLAIVTAKRFDPGFLAVWAPYILAGVPLTVFISVASIALALPLATLGALGRLSSSAPVYATATLYVSVVRGTPLLVQILFVYLALPQMIPGASGVPLVALGILALGFNYGAYLTEIFRAGIEAVPRGQREAATALGMSERRIMRRIILPQAIRVVTPAIGNEFIAMIKDSALVSVLGVQELLWRAQTVGSSKFRALETLLLAAAVYWVLTIVFSFFQDWLERRMRRSNA
jgi:polar amino acid transport system permease protein